MTRSVHRRWQFMALIAVLVLFAGVCLQHQAISDWLKLRGYNPPKAVAQLASDDTMTAKARHLFYVNHPDIADSIKIAKICPAGGEKTVVLGCYVGNDVGIYLYNVTDRRLSGVEQVTAAHETLHAAYRRLPSNERSRVDTMLLDYYRHDLTDQRIKYTIAAYKQSEPNDVVNEMHSVFGTEVPNLPPALEAYYKQYFTDRSKITGYTAQYESEFTSRQARITTYDSQLAGLKQQITSDESDISRQKTAIDTQNQSLQADRSAGRIEVYNDGAAGYNAAVNRYNDLVNATKAAINQYNVIVSERNQIVLEEQQLVQALSPSALPSTQ